MTTMMGTLPTAQSKSLELQRIEDGGMVAVGILILILSTINLTCCTLFSVDRLKWRSILSSADLIKTVSQ